MRTSVPLAALSAGLAALVALGGCDADKPAATASTPSASASTPATKTPAPTTTPPGTLSAGKLSPTPTGSASAEVDAVTSAIDRAAHLGEGGQVVTTALVTDLGTGAMGMCTRTAVQADKQGKPVAAEVWAGTASSTDVSSMCDQMPVTTHYIAIGSDAYVEVPANSGTYQHVLISPSILNDLASTSAGNQVQQFEKSLPEAVSAASQGNGAYRLTFTALDVIKRAASYAGLTQDQTDAVSAGSVTLTYQVDTTTGLVDTVQMDATMTAGDKAMGAQARTTAAWSLDNPIAAPQNVIAGDPVTITNFNQLSQIALGTSPTATQAQ